MVQVTVEQAADLPRLLPVLPSREPGSAVGIVTYVADDFDAPLDEHFTDEGINRDEGVINEGMNALAGGQSAKPPPTRRKI